MKTLYRFLTLVLLTALLTPSMFAGIESIATVTGTDKGVNVTLPAPYNSAVFAGTFNATIDANATKLYCIDLSHYLVYNEAYQDVESTDKFLTYVLNNYYPYKTNYTGKLSSDAEEACAVQLALWNFSDNLNINAVTVSSTIKSRALAIVQDANLNSATYSLNDFSIVVPTQSFTIGSAITFTVQVYNDNGVALPNASITLSTTGGTLSQTTVTTGANGITPVITLTPTSNLTSATITATGTAGIPSGTKYYHKANPNGKQKLVLAKPTVATRTITKQINWYGEINLSVEKTADKDLVSNGDFINYILTVSNTGTANAENVVVSDQLPAILDFVSCTPAGAYNPATGTWAVGTLDMGATSVCTIKTKVDYSNVYSTSFTLGLATPYNLFVIEDLTQPSADTEGKVAVGRYCDLRGYSVGDKLPPNSGDVLVVGDHLTFITGRVYNGRAVYQNHLTSTTGFSADDGIVKATVLDFAQAKIELENLSAQLSLLTVNGTQTFEYGHIALTGTAAGLNVFNVDGDDLLTANNFTIDVPAGAVVVVNISGTETRIFGGFEVNGTTKDKVLLNFYEAEELTFSGIDVRATVLAPKAALTFPAGIVTGQLIVKSMTGSGQVNLCPFTGSLPQDIRINNIATVVGANQNNMPGYFFSNASIASVASPASVTSVKSTTEEIPVEFAVAQNYPNPFNPSTVIKFSVPEAGNVKLAVYNITGELVSDLISGYVEAGNHQVSFDATDLPSGIYICRMTAGAFSSSVKMILQK